jgi:hypothetical protein
MPLLRRIESVFSRFRSFTRSERGSFEGVIDRQPEFHREEFYLPFGTAFRYTETKIAWEPGTVVSFIHARG